MRETWKSKKPAASIVPLVVTFLALPAPAGAQAVGCGGSRISYVQTGDGPDVTEMCGSSVCQEPVLPELTFTFDPGCNPYFGTCGGTAIGQVTFPGNHNNGFNQFYSWATLQLYSLNGTLIGDCGHPFATITHDVGTVTVTGGANCTTPGTSTADLQAIACYQMGSCQKVASQRLDFDFEAGCIIPPMQECNGDASCMECTAGGAGPGGGGPGVGGPGDPDLGPGAQLRYAAGGAGRAGLPGSVDWNVTLGRYWSHDYAERIVPLPDQSRVWLITKYGTYREFSSLNGTTNVYDGVAPSSEKRTLTWLGTGAGWTLSELDGTVHAFNSGGYWTSTTDRNGNVTQGFPTGNQLDSVTFPDGRSEEFSYDPVTGKLESITELGVDDTPLPAWEYTWTGDDLTRVDRPDGTALVFTYDATHPGYLARMDLEGTDGTSIRVLRGWEYDADGNVTRTWAGDASPVGPNAVDVWTFAFDDPEEPTVTTVTDPLGQEITYTLGRDTVSNNVKVLQVDGDCPVCGVRPNSQLDYEDAENPLLPTQVTDGRGTVTSFSYDAFGQVLSRTEADGEPGLQRTTTWTYDATYPALVTSVEQPSVVGGASVRTTDWTRDADGNATVRTISGVEAGSAFSYETVTSFNTEGQPLTIDPDGHEPDPMDLSVPTDVTSFAYDPARGNLLADTRTDPLVGATTFGYDPFNRRTSVTDPNGVETETTYDELDRVTEVRQVGASPPTDDLVTSYSYNTFGDLSQVTPPRGNATGYGLIEYGHDAAGRLISVERKPDASTPGERTLYTLDAAGNRTLEELQRWDVGSSAWATVAATEYRYSNRCQVDAVIQAPGTSEEAVTEYDYDCNGNLSAQWDPNHDPGSDPPTTSYTYDALDRLTEVSQPWAGGGNAVTTYTYDVQDHLISVTDAEGNVTDHTYSDRDLLTYELSTAFVDPAATCNPAPACNLGCGCTFHSYDEHGELTSTTDARGVTMARTVDPLDRVTKVDYPDDSLDTDYDYDTEPASCSGTSFEIGRLGSITRDGEAIEYCYDRFGRVTRDGELTYGYDANGNRTGIGYPGNVAATYTFDFADREVSLTVTSPGSTEPVVTAASYLPSGPLSGLTLGSGTVENRAFDGRYVPTAIGASGDPSGLGERTWSYETDGVGNVLEIVEQQVCSAAPLQLQSQTVTTTETVTHCSSIEAGSGYIIDAPGDVTFDAGSTIVLQDGFSVLTGGSFTAIAGGNSELSRRTYGYQAPQYFLTSADGPWGILDWTYDKIGNRLTETRDGASPDTYVYLTNGTGNTPILDQVLLGVLGTRDYTWGAAGHLEEVAAGANVLDFGADDEGRLSGVDRTAASEAVTFSYDGRSFLRSAQETAGGTRSVEPLYDSAGLVHALRRKASPTDPEELVVFLYLAGRPVAQLASDGTGTESWTYLTTDHLGTPLVATDDAGVVTWGGGFEPYGRDYQQGTMADALDNGIYLRLPGQWEDTSWQEASSGAGVFYNVHRWYHPGVGRYTRPDPIGIIRSLTLVHPFAIAESNPVRFIDLIGLDALTSNPDVQDCFFCLLKGANFGVSDFEKAAWVTQDSSGNIGCVSTGWMLDRGKASWPAGMPFPQGSEAFGHTHPTRSRTQRSQPEPSQNDQNAARKARRPVYTITPNGVWKYDPSTNMVTQELPSGWTKDPKKRCKKRCPQILQ